MKRWNYQLLFTALLCFALLAGCSSDNHSSTKPDNHNSAASNEQNDDITIDKNKDQDMNQQDAGTTAKDNNAQTNKGNNNGGQNQQADTSITEQLKMKSSYIKQPTAFPVKGKVTANISKNTDNAYTIDYQTAAGKKAASFSGTLYKSAAAAKDELDTFMDGKAVPENKETKTDLGHGLAGYGEGAAGHAYFSWKEGNWVMSISSLTKDQMDNPSIAKQMVNFLEKHYLPAPKEEGIVYVDYPDGGKKVNVDIRWQKNNMVYQLKTNEVPNDALKMAASVK